jgi:iron complex outermembrane receptor protein
MLAALGIVPAAAQAQAQTQAAPTSDQLGDIVVTAQRRSEPLQRVPLAATAFTAADLGTRKIDTATDLIKSSPGLVGGNNNGNSAASSFFIRGLGQDDSSPLSDPAVGVYIDDVYVARQYANNLTTYDIDRIEVLRGPQGIFYGRNTSGGAVKVETVKPSDQFDVHGEAQYGNYRSYQLKGSVNIPISDTFFMRVGAFTTQRDKSLVKNIETGKDNYVANSTGQRLQFRYLPSDRFTVDASLERTRSTTPGDTSANLDVPGSDIYHTQSAYQGNYSHVRDLRGILTIAYRGDDFTVKSISAYDRPEWAYSLDFTGSPNPFFILTADLRARVLSQEFQLSSDMGRLHFTGGLFAFNERDHNIDEQNVFSGVVHARNRYTNETTSLAAYGQLKFDITDNLKISGGLRYTDERKHLDIRGYSIGADGSETFLYDNSDLIAAGNATHIHTHKLDPRLELDYQATPGVLFYASFTEGFRSGSWNQRAFSPADITIFQPEKVKAYELGAKTDLFNRRARLNISLYQNDYNNFIINRLNPVSGNFVTANAAKVRIRGIEAELSGKVTSAMTLHGFVTGTDSKYLSLAPDTGITTDNKVKYTPPFTASAGFDYVLPYDTIGAWTLSANLYHSARYYVGLNNFPAEHVPTLNLVDTVLKFQPTDHWTLSLYCTNCTNKKYFTSAVAAPSIGIDTQIAGTPRLYGLRIGYSFR